MAKKQTRRSISVSRTTYERLKAFCESNNISMSQFVETRVGDFLGQGGQGETATLIPTMPRPVHSAPGLSVAKPAAPLAPRTEPAGFASPQPRPAAPAQPVPMTSAAARFAVEPPPPVIKRRTESDDQPAPKPAEKRPDQIFTF
jgi:hypothetical protein